MKKRIIFLSLVIAVTMLLVACDTLDSTKDYIDVTNATGYGIYFLVISHESELDWPDLYQEDLLEAYGILNNGETFRINISGDYSTSVFDLRAEDEDGDTYAIYGIDAETHDWTITLSDME